ncbi:aminotransferase class I/II-fold pyridoxal phosphate-dependent enzyme [Segetibacter sp. 3557_3]|uniref:aminotransferase class I/II-fold pyridoxal phosphate-dependent enzyme n=1 Tax=Segetibacter sp. 3557_3 TaxID=2547429 RepID=UPI0010588E93|nr:aminotransferase class I/II-fold pyridoxal phosphate-dependent enzyme [Segetibacter sp. 3557_3]TDH26443.1 aminotransferase class I/II-fold pyridoxal phosphate-dependent enzyme [Segetibacter sp. 3557_3]
MADVFAKLVKDGGPLGQHMDRAHGYFAFPKLEGELGPRMTFRGKEMIVWSLNNYLGLVNDPEVRRIDAEAAAKYGMGNPMGARMMSGNTQKHEELERVISEFVSREDTMLLNFGYQGIMSCIDALVNRRDVIVYDAEAHACIVDGVRLHLGQRYAFKHNDVEDCEKQLQRATEMAAKSGGGILVITEGVFGMDGEQGKLKEIVALKQKYEFRLLIDDAHGFGYMGPTGAGADEAQGCQDGVDLYFSTFVKSMGSIGAFISGPRAVLRYLRYNTRSQIFAKSLPLLIVEGMLKRMEMVKTMPELREKLWSNVNRLQSGLKARGFDIGNTNSPVTPIFMKGDVPEATSMVMDLRENYHIFCSIVVYPVIPKGDIIFRIIPTAAHSEEDVDLTLKAFDESKKKLDAGLYKSAQIPNMAEAI